MTMATGYPISSTNLQVGNAAHPSPGPQSQALVSQPTGAVHQRTYQACIPCRQRKVRCDLGSVDSPADPPCSRCRREAKVCYFSKTRRKSKKNQGDNQTSEPGDETPYEVRSNRKRARTSAPPNDDDDDDDDDDQPPRTPGGSVARSQPLRRPTAPKPVQFGEEDEKTSEQTAALLQRAEMNGGHDALNVLFQAAFQRHTRTESIGSSGRRPNFTGHTSASVPDATSPMIDKVRSVSYSNGPMAILQNDPLWKTQIHRNPTSSGAMTAGPLDSSFNAALKAWSRFKFVRAGWFTATEGMDYIHYFFKHLSPLTPVAIPDYRHPKTHKKLLEEEPMLAVTMLLIASRHLKLQGPGSQSRPYAIHQTLGKYLSGIMDRIVWGQEQFGGGFCGAGGQPGSDINPLTRKGLRTLGSVESLVLLTEWHPRAMHFPPDDDDDDLMFPDQPYSSAEITSESMPQGIGGHRMDAWLEPCWRSDRMCWMLLGMAMSLAMEIGVFDNSEWLRHAPSADGGRLSAEDITAYDKRRCSVRDLLLVYVTQTSGRLGLTSMLPGYYSKPEDSDLFKHQIGQQDSVQEITFHFWLRMAAIMRDGNNKIFPNKTFTRDLIRNGDYKAALEQFHQPLLQWRRDFDDCKVVPKHMRSILEIEFEYCRVYLNALGLQAVADRCANDHPSPASTVIDPPLEMARSAVANTVGPDATPIAPATLSKWLGGDRHYMQTVGDGARNLLKVVVDDLYPEGFLRHAPVRTYFRIISVAMMLFKSFSLGATESDVTDSLTLMDRTVDALRTCVVDDVHVASRFADLLDTLTQKLKPRLVRIAADGRAGRSRHVSHHEITQGIPLEYMSDDVQQVSQQQTLDASGIARGQQQHSQPQWSYGNGIASNANITSDNPMYGISNEAYDLMSTDNQYSVMPPPGFNNSSPNGGDNLNAMGHDSSGTTYDTYGSAGHFDNNQDWFALPLNSLLNIGGADVSQSAYGPEIGGQDMLELLLNDHFQQGNTQFQ